MAATRITDEMTRHHHDAKELMLRIPSVARISHRFHVCLHARQLYMFAMTCISMDRLSQRGQRK